MDRVFTQLDRAMCAVIDSWPCVAAKHHTESAEQHRLADTRSRLYWRHPDVELQPHRLRWPDSSDVGLPAVTVVLSWLLLGERISWSTELGLMTIMAGSALAANRVRVEC